MSFGDDNSPAPIVAPPLPPPPPSIPQYASGAGRGVKRGAPFGGTLVTSPLAPAAPANLAKKSLVNM